MKQVIKTLALSATIIAAAITPLSEAFAHGYHRYHGGGHHYYYHGHKHHGRNAAAAGIIGLAAGALIGSALARPAQPRVIYREPAYANYPPAPHYGSMQPWTQGWYNYCSYKFRSFNPRTGTYRGYDGRNHFCNAP